MEYVSKRRAQSALRGAASRQGGEDRGAGDVSVPLRGTLPPGSDCRDPGRLPKQLQRSRGLRRRQGRARTSKFRRWLARRWPTLDTGLTSGSPTVLALLIAPGFLTKARGLFRKNPRRDTKYARAHTAWRYQPADQFTRPVQ